MEGWDGLLARIIHDGSSAPLPHPPPYYGGGMGGGPRRARGAGRRGNTPPGSSEGGVPPSWGFYKGAGPLVRVGEAGSRAEPAREGGILEQDVDRLSGEPACLDAGPSASRLVAAANPRLQQKRS